VTKNPISTIFRKGFIEKSTYPSQSPFPKFNCTFKNENHSAYLKHLSIFHRVLTSKHPLQQFMSTGRSLLHNSVIKITHRASSTLKSLNFAFTGKLAKIWPKVLKTPVKYRKLGGYKESLTSKIQLLYNNLCEG